MASTGNGQLASIWAIAKPVPCEPATAKIVQAHLMISKLIAGLLIGWSALAQSAVDVQKLQDAKAKGFAMPVDVTADGNVSVQAVLLPAPVCTALFGKAIAHQYAVIELTVSNKSPQAALIITSIFSDYSDWLLSGSNQALAAAGFPAQNVSSSSSSLQANPRTLANQVASIEYRIVRGEALDAQAWTGRNWSMRLLQFLGVVATGSEFAFKEVGVVKGIGAFTGQLVPAAQTLWPDATAAQLDRISDFGFRANKVIPKESSDIVVAFFPIDRFITPELKKLFLASPAVFFVPAAALVDKTVRAEIIGVLQRLVGDAQVKSSDSVEGLLSNPKIRGVLDGLSLNKVQIKVNGILSVDSASAPARIDSVKFDNPALPWDAKGSITGVIEGSLLSGGQPAIVESKQYGITVQVVPDQSNSEQLRFLLLLSRAVPVGTVLHFHVTKAIDSKAVDSVPAEIRVMSKDP